MITDVAIAGAGPNGLMLACELGLAGIRTIVLERLPEPSEEPKANGLVGQVVRLVDRRGLYERLSGSAQPPQPNSAFYMFAGMALDLSLLAHSPVYTLPVPQHRLVQVLQQRAVELGGQIRRGHEVTGLSQDDDGVTVHVAGPDGDDRLRARYLVGADGAHSTTRKLSGIAFPGVTYDRTTSRTAHATVPAEWVDPASGALNVPGFGAVLPFVPRRTDRGGFAYAPLPGQAPQIVTTEWDQPETEEPMSLDELRASVRRVLGVDVPLEEPTGEGPRLLRRLVGGNVRMAERFRDRRVFLVGDAAHAASNAGGQGLNLGMQDAANLGWKLAAELRGRAPVGLLDTYQTERKAAAHRVHLYGKAQAALIAPGGEVTALRELFTELLRDPGTVQRLADLTAGTDLRYDMGGDDEHPLVGGFAPDLDLRTSTGTVRLAELTRTARPLLLDLTENAALAGALSDWHDQVEVIAAHPLSPAPGVTALLIRPDCYVAWACAAPDPAPAELAQLHATVRRWFGAAEVGVHTEWVAGTNR